MSCKREKNKLCQILTGILLIYLCTVALQLPMISLERGLEYNISSVSPKYLLGEEEVWITCLWRRPVLLAGTTFSTRTMKHFSMQKFLPSCCNQCQGLTRQVQPRNHGSQGGQAPARMGRKCGEQLSRIYSDTAGRAGLAFPKWAIVPQQQQHCGFPQLALWCSTLWRLIWDSLSSHSTCQEMQCSHQPMLAVLHKKMSYRNCEV